MDVVDKRIKAHFNGYTENGGLIFVEDDTKEYIIVGSESVLGNSILEERRMYSLRKLPGKRFMVEEPA